MVSTRSGFSLRVPNELESNATSHRPRSSRRSTVARVVIPTEITEYLDLLPSLDRECQSIGLLRNPSTDSFECMFTRNATAPGIRAFPGQSCGQISSVQLSHAEIHVASTPNAIHLMPFEVSTEQIRLAVDRVDAGQMHPSVTEKLL